MTVVRVVVELAAQAEEKRRRIRVTKWVIFTVLFGLFPLLASAIAVENNISTEALIGHAELYLIASVLIGDALGRIWNARAVAREWSIVCFAALALVLAHCALKFGTLAEHIRDCQKICPEQQYASIFTFVISILVSYWAVELEG
jgi:hypothetical protein